MVEFPGNGALYCRNEAITKKRVMFGSGLKPRVESRRRFNSLGNGITEPKVQDRFGRIVDIIHRSIHYPTDRPQPMLQIQLINHLHVAVKHP